MRVSINWLRDYVDITKSPSEIAKDLSLFGHEAESVEKIGSDTILDLEITPNRGDCLSILGIAREISALHNITLKSSTTQLKSIAVEDLDKKIEVKIEKPEICPRFTTRIIDNIKIGDSAKWMQERLASYGFRPINNVVDITNYVMVATGQPLHAFDYDKIKNGLMNIRLAKKDEEIMTLDGQNRVLNEGAIIIEDSEKIYDLAGIMGGVKSEVDEKTKTIVLQGAIFDPVLIRKTSKYLNHTTDASYRYERGVDYEGTIAGVDMAAALIKDSCPEAQIGELLDIKSENPIQPKIEMDIDRVNKLLGTDISSNEASEFLQRLGFKVTHMVNRTSDVKMAMCPEVAVPSYREYDVKIWQDLAEEIARVYGYNKIGKVRITKYEEVKENLEFQKREYIKDILKDVGFTEIYSYSFAKRDKIEALEYKIADCVEVANPLSPETMYLRPSILPSLLAAIAKNPWAPEVNIFEIGKVFTSNAERWQLGIATVGKTDAMLLSVLKTLELEAKIESVEQKILDQYKIRRPVNYLIIDFEHINIAPDNYSLNISPKKYKPISKYPPTVRDLAFVVKDNIEADKITETIKSQDDKILLVELFDEFSFKNGTKNIAFHIWLEDLKKPLDAEEADSIIKKIIKEISETYQAKLRS